MGLIPPFCTMSRFLSTPSARRATLSSAARSAGLGYFYPRPPRGGRQTKGMDATTPDLISIHALREEGDIEHSFWSLYLLSFLSTPSARRATLNMRCGHCTSCHFYPRPPRGGRRRWRRDRWCRRTYFYPRPPRGGRPAKLVQDDLGRNISIHALREEGDSASALSRHRTSAYFYPRPPRGGRLDALIGFFGADQHFYPRPPRGGRG